MLRRICSQSLHSAAFKRIATVTLAASLAGAIYVVLAPNWYRSILTVVPSTSQKQGGGIASLLGGDLGSLASTLAPSMGSTDATRIAAILQSISLADTVIEKFDLRKRYHQEFQEEAREALWSHCDIKTLPKPNLVQLACEDQDPEFAKALLDFFAEQGNQTFRRVSASSATEEVRFLENRTAELRKTAESAAARMQEFQEAHQIIDLDVQAKAVVSSLALLNGQRINKQLELGYAQTYSSRNEASTQQIESQLSVISGKLRELEDPGTAPAGSSAQPRRGGRTANSGLFPAALAVPKLRAEYEELVRDRKVAEATLLVSLERLESARANEAGSVSTFQVLDFPTVPTRKSRPKRLAILVASAMLGFLLSAGYEYWRNGGNTAFLRAVSRQDDGDASGSRLNQEPVRR